MSREVEDGFAVSLSLDQENFFATQAKRGEDAPSAVWARQSVTPEEAAPLRPLQE